MTLNKQEIPRPNQSHDGVRRVSFLRPPGSARARPQEVKAPNTRPTALNDFQRSSIDWSWDCDAKLCISSVSEGFFETTGVLPVQIIGQPLESLGEFVVDRESGPTASSPIARLSAGQSIRGAVFDVLRGEVPVRVFLNGVPICAPGGEIIGFHGTAKLASMAAQRAAGQDHAHRILERARKTQLDLVQNVQHELRTPLNAINGFAEMMRVQLADGNDPRYAEYCDDIVSASQHLLGLIEDLVGAQEAETTLAPVTQTRFDLNVMLEEVARLLSSKAQEAGIELRIAAQDADASVETDRRRLKQICINLLENAIKFTPAGKAVGVDYSCSEEGHYTIRIWDEGPGIAEEDQAVIWQRFRKAGPTDADIAKTPGFGLGLSVVKTLAKDIHAQLEIDSTLGEGSTFIIHN